MAGKDNLKPIRSVGEAREKGKKGGKASGEARRARKTLKEDLLKMLSEGDTQEKILNALTRQAQRGNIRAFEVLRDTIGEKPTENKETDVTTLALVSNILAEVKKQTDEINRQASGIHSELKP